MQGKAESRARSCARLLLITRRPIYGRRDRFLRHVIDGQDVSFKTGRTTMRITLVGSRHFGVTTLNMLRQHGGGVGGAAAGGPQEEVAGEGNARGQDEKKPPGNREERDAGAVGTKAAGKNSTRPGFRVCPRPPPPRQ